MADRCAQKRNLFQSRLHESQRIVSLDLKSASEDLQSVQQRRDLLKTARDENKKASQFGQQQKTNAES